MVAVSVWRNVVALVGGLSLVATFAAWVFWLRKRPEVTRIPWWVGLTMAASFGLVASVETWQPGRASLVLGAGISGTLGVMRCVVRISGRESPVAQAGWPA